VVVAVVVVAAAAVGGYVWYTGNDTSRYETLLETDGRILDDVADAAAILNDVVVNNFPDLTEEQSATIVSCVETFTAAVAEAKTVSVPDDMANTQSRFIRGLEQYVEAGQLTLDAVSESDATKLREAADIFNDGSENLLDVRDLLELKQRSLDLDTNIGGS